MILGIRAGMTVPFLSGCLNGSYALRFKDASTGSHQVAVTIQSPQGQTVTLIGERRLRKAFSFPSTYISIRTGRKVDCTSTQVAFRVACFANQCL
jgi:hypothetical protein